MCVGERAALGERGPLAGGPVTAGAGVDRASVVSLGERELSATDSTRRDDPFAVALPKLIDVHLSDRLQHLGETGRVLAEPDPGHAEARVKVLGAAAFADSDGAGGVFEEVGGFGLPAGE